MNQKTIFLLLFCLGLTIKVCHSQEILIKDFSQVFEKHGVSGCFVLYDQSTNTYFRHNAPLCDTNYIPASTFKIPHALIAIEEGLIKDTSQVVPWDGTKHPYDVWNKDQTIKTAMKYSCVPVFVGFAEKIPIDTYYNYVRAFDYGNKNLTGPPTRFWLAGLFRISANQQVEFLKRFYNYELPVKKQSIDLVKDIIILKKTDGYVLSGKTGGGMLDENRYIMWLVGYLEKDGNPYFYAMNFISDNFNKHSKARYAITKEIMTRLQLID